MSSKFLSPLLSRRSGSRTMGLFFASALCFSGMAVVKFREAVEATGNVCAVENPTKVSPCDCTVMFAGEVEGDRVPQYHHFHAPCAFRQTARRHFHGECLPVFKSFLKKFNDVFSVQERVVVVGEWRHGSFNLAAVAASNVGNIRLDRDPDLKTNRHRVVLRHLGGDIDVRCYTEKPLQFGVGEHLGEFRLGSTVVVVFEAPADFAFSVRPGDKLLAGERLGGVGAPVRPASPEKAKFLHY